MKNIRTASLLTLACIWIACLAVLNIADHVTFTLLWNNSQKQEQVKGNDVQTSSPDKECTVKFSLKKHIPDGFKCSFKGYDSWIPHVKAVALVICVFALIIFDLCFSIVCPDIRRRRQIGAIGTIIIMTLLLLQISELVFSTYSPHVQYISFIILALPALVITQFFGFRPAVCSGILTAVLVSILLGGDEPTRSGQALLVGIAMTFAGGYFSHKMKKTTYEMFFLCNLFWLTVFAFPMMVCFELANAKGWSIAPSTFLKLFCVSLAGSFLSTVIAMFCMRAFELIFRIETNMTFMDLTDASHTNLRRLRDEAPGTWTHCQQVADVAESAALAIGANHLKVRACALYHDLGKLEAPKMFTENSPSPNGETDVKGMEPKEAAETLRKHVSTGKEMMGYRYKSVKEAIASHHGTNFIGSFYDKAVERYGKEQVNEMDYRHKGPLPSNREEMILMLADSACAAVQSLTEKTEEKIEEQVSSVFQEQLRNRQYDQSNIKIDELLKVYESVLEYLKKSAKDHSRVNGR